LQVHFLSHYYTELPADNPLFVTALTIPDLATGFSKAHNSVVLKNPPPRDTDLLHIHNGILRHYAGDKWFHNSPLFLEHLSLFSIAFEGQGLSRERLRLSVIAHLAVEMMLDRQIMIYNSNLCRDFYDKLDRTDESILANYFDYLALEAEKKSFLSKFQFFKQRRFLFLFSELENIVFALNRVYSSVTKTEFTDDEKVKFHTALSNIDMKLRYSWQEILKH